MRATSSFSFDIGMSTWSCSAFRPLRMRVRRSAIGSLTAIYLPARLGQAGDHPLVGELAHADPAHPELAEVRPRPAATPAAVVVPCLELLGALLAHHL